VRKYHTGIRPFAYLVVVDQPINIAERVASFDEIDDQSRDRDPLWQIELDNNVRRMAVCCGPSAILRSIGLGVRAQYHVTQAHMPQKAISNDVIVRADRNAAEPCNESLVRMTVALSQHHSISTTSQRYRCPS
jgi:hypothetical protein